MSTEPTPPRVSIREIAKHLGVNHATVSLALRNSPRISEATRLRVQEAARAMGYRPDPALAALQKYRRDKTAAPVTAALAWVNTWPDPRKLRSFKEFDAYWHGAEQCAAKFGYRLEEFLLNKENPADRLAAILYARNISGIILPPRPSSRSLPNFDWSKFSVLRLGRSGNTPNFHVVTSDQVANAMLAFERIHQRGYTRVGYVTSSKAWPTSRWLVRAGILLAQAEATGRAQIPHILFDEPDDLHSLSAAEQMHVRDCNQKRLSDWLKEYQPDAIFTELSYMRQMLADLGYQIPGDIGLAVNSILDGDADSGIDQQSWEIGRVAALALISLINDHDLGVPENRREILIQGTWQDGASLAAKS
jgi:DNA-binding LacI/PurR family transcriptional regulator